MTTIPKSQHNAGPVVSCVISDYFLFDRFAHCPSCGDPEGFFLPAEVYPYFPDGGSVQCTTCGAYDHPVIRLWTVHHPDNHLLASPGFPTEGEARRFGNVFGLTGYCLQDLRCFYVSEGDDDPRKRILYSLSRGRDVYERLLESLPVDSDPETLRQLALSLDLRDYALPQFSAAFSEERPA